MASPLPPPHSPQTFTLQGNAAGVPYTFTCVVSKGGRTATAAGALLARFVPLPSVVVDGLPAGDKANAADRIVLTGSVRSAVPDSLSYNWTQSAGPFVNLTDPSVRFCFHSHAHSHALIMSFAFHWGWHPHPQFPL